MFEPGSAAVESIAPSPPFDLRFRLPEGAISSAWITENPHRVRAGVRSAAQRAGIAYERKMLKFLANEAAALWPRAKSRAGLWIAYCDEGDKRNFCQPDLVIDDESESRCMIVEIKVRWTADAWWQLEKFYRPVLQKLLPRREWISVCVCKSFDPFVRCPAERLRHLDTLSEARSDQFNVLVVK